MAFSVAIGALAWPDKKATVANTTGTSMNPRAKKGPADSGVVDCVARMANISEPVAIAWRTVPMPMADQILLGLGSPATVHQGATCRAEGRDYPLTEPAVRPRTK
jgi:hypothetical protein